MDEVCYLPEADSPDVEAETVVCYFWAVRSGGSFGRGETYILGRSSQFLGCR